MDVRELEEEVVAIEQLGFEPAEVRKHLGVGLSIGLRVGARLGEGGVLGLDLVAQVDFDFA